MPTLHAKPNYTKGIQNLEELSGLPVTPSDSTDLPNGPAFGIQVTGAGNVAVNLAGGGTATLTGLSAGQILRVNVSRILATNTTATGIFALYQAGGR